VALQLALAALHSVRQAAQKARPLEYLFQKEIFSKTVSSFSTPLLMLLVNFVLIRCWPQRDQWLRLAFYHEHISNVQYVQDTFAHEKRQNSACPVFFVA